jgi:hypothetical protein
MTVVTILALAFPATVLRGQEEHPRRIVFNGSNDLGELWANVGLTMQRLDEDYIPMVVAVVNRSKETVTIDRDAIRLIERDGARYPMPALRELRKGYGQRSLDARAASGAGIPWEVWQSERHLIDSNFFPDLMSSRRALVIDEVNLPPSYAMIDIVYFAKPKRLTVGEPFLLEVHAIGWEAPVRLGIVLN